MVQQSTTHWICINEVLAHNWLPTLENVTAVLYRPNIGKVRIFEEFYGHPPEILNNPGQINRLLEAKISQGIENRVLLLEPRNTTEAKQVIDAIETPFVLVERRYSPSDEPDWHDKSVFHKFLEENYQHLVLPKRKALEGDEAMDYTAQLLSEHERVVVQCIYSSGGFHSRIFDKTSFSYFTSTGHKLPDLCKEKKPELCKSKKEALFLIAPYYTGAVDLCCTSVATDGIDIYEVRYPILDGISARGTMPCKDKSIQREVLSIVDDVTTLIHGGGYSGFLNFDFLKVNGSTYLSEINFRIPQGFLYELFLRERPEVNPLWSLNDFPDKRRKELYMDGGHIQGRGYLYTD